LPELRPFQAPNLVAMSNAMQEQSLNAMREGQLMGDEREKNNMRALFADPNFNPNSPDTAQRILAVAPRTGHATYTALLRGYADRRAAEASVRAGAASDRAAALSVRQAQAADLERSIKLTEWWMDRLDSATPENYAAMRAAAVRDVPNWAPMWPEQYDPAAVRRLQTRAADSIKEQAERNKPPADFTLSPEQTRFSGRTGQPIATAPARPVRDPARETKIQDIMDTFGVDRRTAVGIESGVLRPIADPVTGQTRLIDLTNNTFRETTPAAPAAPAPPAPAPLVTGPRANITPPPAAEPAPAAPAPAPAAEAPPAPRRTLFEMAQMPLTTGATPALMQAGQNVLGQIGANIVTPEFTERRQAFSNMQNELIRAVINNPRFPVAEQERIRREINIEPGVLLDPQTLLARIKSLDTTLRASLANREREGEDTSLPVETRRNARAAANDIKNFLATLGVPQDQSSTAAPAAPPPRRNALNRRTQTGAPQRLRFNPDTGELEPVQ